MRLIQFLYSWGRRGLPTGLLLAVLWGLVAQTGRAQPAPKPLLPLKVVGTRLLDSQNQRVRLHGVNAPSLEWSSDGEGHILTSVETALRDWHVNIIRLPLAQDRWFGKAPDQSDGGSGYRALVRQIVDLAASKNCYVILDLQWSDAGEWGKQIGQHVMPDGNSVAFWKEVAPAYKNNPAVLFDLYNEPHDVSWDIWRDGGEVTEKADKFPATTYAAVGMQTLLETVRATGAKNVIVAGGLGWASDFTGILAGKALTDTKGNGVLYADHFYPFGGETIPQWTARMERVAAKLPVFIGEFGSDPPGGHGETGEQWVPHILQVLKDHDWNWAAWDFHPAAVPCLITGWDYAPTLHFGVFVKKALVGTLPAYTPPLPAPMKSAIFTNGLLNGWQNYGWAKLDYNNTAPVHDGKTSIRVEAGPYEAIFLHHDPFSTRPFRTLTFWLHGGPQGGQKLKVQAVIAGKPQTEFLLPPLYPNAWRLMVVPLTALGMADKPNMEGFWIQNLSGAALPAFYVDGIALSP